MWYHMYEGSKIPFHQLGLEFSTTLFIFQKSRATIFYLTSLFYFYFSHLIFPFCSLIYYFIIDPPKIWKYIFIFLRYYFSLFIKLWPLFKPTRLSIVLFCIFLPGPPFTIHFLLSYPLTKIVFFINVLYVDS